MTVRTIDIDRCWRAMTSGSAVIPEPVPTVPTSRQRRPIVPAVLGFGLPVAFVVLWSAGFVGAELGARVMTADSLLMWRFVSASVILLLACALTGRRVDRAALRRHVPLGILMQFAYLAGVFHGVEAGVSGATVALVAALQPVLADPVLQPWRTR